MMRRQKQMTYLLLSSSQTWQWTIFISFQSIEKHGLRGSAETSVNKYGDGSKPFRSILRLVPL